MIHIQHAHDHLTSADGVAATLDAGYAAFEAMLSVIRTHEDPAESVFIPLVMAAASAADGRNAIIFAPSLPARRLHPPESADQPGDVAAAAIMAELAALSELLATRLAGAARFALDPGDQTACRDAARSASEIFTLLTGSGL
jgi:hypothetical protein